LNDSADRRALGVLYIVATPIGNLEDVSARALRVLSEVAVIACEDTRHSARLLSAYAIRTPTLSYFEHNEQRRTPELIERLGRGENVALITDAGTPAISDPGFRVAAVPGPSAAVAAISVSGLPTDRFTFEGFLPQRASARRKTIEELKREPRTMVFFEAARRLVSTLSDMAAVFGAEREAAVVREISKTFEESVRGTLAELHTRFTAVEPRGEIVLLIAGAPASAISDAADAGSVAVTVEMLRDAGLSLKDASAVVARLTGTSRREVYQQALGRRSKNSE
jgi:16S rRNA (cytidine1402-2'-O)-methyltransferase